MIRREWERKCDARAISRHYRVVGVFALRYLIVVTSGRACFFLPISPAIAHRSRGDRCGRFSLRVNKRSLKNIFCAKLSVSIIFHSNAIMRTFSGQKLESITYANLCSNKDSNRLAFYRLAVRQGSFASVKSRSFTFIACPYRISVKCICRGDFAAIEWKASGLENGD